MDLQIARMKNFVGGEFVEAERGAWERVIAPATGEVIAEVPRCAGLVYGALHQRRCPRESRSGSLQSSCK
jgi:hypothetical protein